MADQTTTQFLPATVPAARAPVAGAAAEAAARPAPALAYSTPSASGRPGVLTAMGVMSIIIACLSVVASVTGGVQIVGFVAMAEAGARRTAARAAAAASAPTLATTSPATAPTTGPAVPTQTLTAAEVQAVVQRVQAASGNALTPAQVATLRAELQNPAQQLVLPGTAASSPVTVNVDQAGVFVQMSGGWVSLDGQGKLVSQFSTSNPFGRFRTPVAAIVIAGADVVLGVLLAVVLLVAGLMVLRQSPRARPLHRFYAWVKIPLALAGAAGMAWIYAAFIGNLAPPATGGPSPRLVMFWMWATGMSLLGCAYPVAVLLALRSRTVRAYYNSISGAA